MHIFSFIPYLKSQFFTLFSFSTFLCLIIFLQKNDIISHIYYLCDTPRGNYLKNVFYLL